MACNSLGSGRALAPLLGGQRIEGREDAVSARVDANGREVAPPDHSLGVNDHERALGEAILLTIRTVATRYVTLRFEVSEQGEMDVARFAECAVAPGTVNRNAEHLRAVLVELRLHFVIDADLIAADRAPVGRVEDEHDRSASEISERNRLIGCGVQLESRRLLTGRHERVS